MALYVDTPFKVPVDHPKAPRCFLGRMAAHLMADSTEELVAYAQKIGMNPSWMQHKGRPTEHFDLVGAKLAHVMADPKVKKIGAKEMARMWMRRRELAAQMELPYGGR